MERISSKVVGSDKKLNPNFDKLILKIYIVLCLIGYFIYGGVDGLLMIAMLGILLALSTTIALIPFAGVFIQWFIISTYIVPFILDLTGLASSWLTSLMVISVLIIGIVYTASFTVLLISTLTEWMDY